MNRLPSPLHIRCFVAFILLSGIAAAPQQQGYQASVPVTEATRIDSVFPVANQSPAELPPGWLEDYKSTDQSYELYVPPNYNDRKSWPLVLFVSPGQRSAGFKAWQSVCEKEGVLFAGPHDAGNQTDMRQRVRIVLDVLDEIRRTYNVDPDRTYITGFSGGGRVACIVGFALPEYFGGVVPLCAGGELREEPWLRHRVIDRLSVAMLTGEKDFNRGEVERFRGPILRDVGVRTMIEVQPGLGHGIPNSKVLAETFAWLEAGLRDRQALAKKVPATRMERDNTLSRQEQSEALFAEAQQKIKNPQTLYSGLMLMQGVMQRWPDLPQSSQARQTLLKYENDPNSNWQAEDIAEQRTFLIALVRGLDAYATGPLPQNYQAQKPAMLQAAIALWQRVIDDGQDVQATQEGKQRLPVLQELLEAK